MSADDSRQGGRTETLISEPDLRSMRAYRLQRLRAEMAKSDYGGCVLFDPNNIRYATDSRNMHIYTLRWPFRYVFIPTSGKVTLFEYFGSEHLSATPRDH